MNPLLKEIQHDRLRRQINRTSRDLDQYHCVCKNRASGMWDGGSYPSGAWPSSCGCGQRQPMNSMPMGDAIPQTFLPQTVGQPVPPPQFEQAAAQAGPFNPFCQPIYPPGCPTPGCPGSYPGYTPPNNLPPTRCYQQEIHFQPRYGSSHASPSRYRPQQ